MSSPQYVYPPPPPPPDPNHGSGAKTAIAAGAIVASLAANLFLFVQIKDARTEDTKTRDLLQAQIETLKENSASMTAAQRERMEALKGELANSKKELSAEAMRAKKDALSYADEQARKLSDQQQQTAQKLSTDISGVKQEVKQTADTASAKIADVGNEVSNVKKDAAKTNAELNQTISELKKVSGDLGVTSGYVATNSKELAELKKRGERNYFEFKIAKSKDYQKVGDIAILIKKTDMKKNRFTIEVRADDKVTEKKDRYINEPLQFYVSKSLYELVVNSVGKDVISGYLATPKYGNGR